MKIIISDLDFNSDKKLIIELMPEETKHVQGSAGEYSQTVNRNNLSHRQNLQPKQPDFNEILAQVLEDTNKLLATVHSARISR